MGGSSLLISSFGQKESRIPICVVFTLLDSISLVFFPLQTGFSQRIVLSKIFVISSWSNIWLWG
jgi:hypothetical protein